MAQSNITSRSIGFVGLLTLLFIALKLTHYINWSWLWILAPLWISVGIGFAILFILLVIYIIYYASDGGT